MHASKGSLRNDRRSLNGLKTAYQHYDQNRDSIQQMIQRRGFHVDKQIFMEKKKMAKSELNLK